MDKPARYSDDVPYEKRRYWYFTTHGVGPGSIPRDLKVLEIREGKNDKGTWGEYVCLDGVVNTDELRSFDMRELAPPQVDFKHEAAFVEKYLEDHNFFDNGYFDCVYTDKDGLHIDRVEGDHSHTHGLLRSMMALLGYKQKYENVIGDADSDWYTANHCYVRNDRWRDSV